MRTVARTGLFLTRAFPKVELQKKAVELFYGGRLPSLTLHCQIYTKLAIWVSVWYGTLTHKHEQAFKTQKWPTGKKAAEGALTVFTDKRTVRGVRFNMKRPKKLR